MALQTSGWPERRQAGRPCWGRAGCRCHPDSAAACTMWHRQRQAPGAAHQKSSSNVAPHAPPPRPQPRHSHPHSHPIPARPGAPEVERHVAPAHTPPRPRSGPPPPLPPQPTPRRRPPVVEGHVGGAGSRREAGDLVEPAGWQVEHLPSTHFALERRALALQVGGWWVGGPGWGGAWPHMALPSAKQCSAPASRRQFALAGPRRAGGTAGPGTGPISPCGRAHRQGLTGKSGKRRFSSASGRWRSTRLKLSGSPAAAAARGATHPGGAFAAAAARGGGPT